MVVRRRNDEVRALSYVRSMDKLGSAPLLALDEMESKAEGASANPSTDYGSEGSTAIAHSSRASREALPGDRALDLENNYVGSRDRSY